MRTAIFILGADCIQCAYLRRSISELKVEPFFFSETGHIPFFLPKFQNIIISESAETLSYLRMFVSLALKYDKVFIYSLSEEGWDVLYELQPMLSSKFDVLLPSTLEHYKSVNNKWALYNTAIELEIPTLKTELSVNVFDKFSTHNFDKNNLIRKPNVGSGARGFKLLTNFMELSNVRDSEQHHIQPFIKSNIQYKCTALSISGKIQSIACIQKERYFPRHGGSLTFGTCLKPPKDFIEILTKICQSTNWTGVIDTDFIYDVLQEKMFLLEVNPRMPACVKYCDYLGVDLFLTLIGSKLNIDNDCIKKFDVPNLRGKIPRNDSVQYLTLDILLLIGAIFRFDFKLFFTVFVSLFKSRNRIDIYSGSTANLIKVMYIQGKKLTSVSFMKKKFFNVK